MHMQYEVKCLYVVSHGANAKYGKMLMQNTEKRGSSAYLRIRIISIH